MVHQLDVYNVQIYNRNDIPIYVIRVMDGKATQTQSGSWKNEDEGDVICEILGCGRKYKALQASIGVVALYSAQKQYIRKQARSMMSDKAMEDIVISTVDAFQGQEKELMILSLVRNVTDCGHNQWKG